jgi:hypothetical protein
MTLQTIEPSHDLGNSATDLKGDDLGRSSSRIKRLTLTVPDLTIGIERELG